MNSSSDSLTSPLLPRSPGANPNYSATESDHSPSRNTMGALHHTSSMTNTPQRLETRVTIPDGESSTLRDVTQMIESINTLRVAIEREHNQPVTNFTCLSPSSERKCMWMSAIYLISVATIYGVGLYFQIKKGNTA